MGLSGKVALITGSARGIGRAIALELAHHGANIVVNDISPKSEIDKTLEEIKKSGNMAIGIKADITVFDEVDRMVKEVINKFGKIDILINNAGITRDALLIRMKEEDWDAVIKINLKGIHWVIVGGESGHKARLMEEQWAINIKDQCEKANVPFFFKQWGTWGADKTKRNKKANGRKLQGQLWEAYPKVA